MKLPVYWSSVAESRLTEIWLASRRRHAVTAAANRLDAMLSERPFEISESRVEGLRVALDAPLGVLFRVEESPSCVLVLAVWDF